MIDHYCFLLSDDLSLLVDKSKIQNYFLVPYSINRTYLYPLKLQSLKT